MSEFERKIFLTIKDEELHDKTIREYRRFKDLLYEIYTNVNYSPDYFKKILSNEEVVDIVQKISSLREDDVEFFFYNFYKIMIETQTYFDCVFMILNKYYDKSEIIDMYETMLYEYCLEEFLQSI